MILKFIIVLFGIIGYLCGGAWLLGFWLTSSFDTFGVRIVLVFIGSIVLYSICGLAAVIASAWEDSK